MSEPCPFCGEEIDADAIKCVHCGESLEDDEPAAEGGGSSAKLIIIILLVVVVVPIFCLLPIIAAIAIPNLIEARKNGNEAAAIGALKTISVAQSLFREADKENDGNLDYATLQELSSAGSSGLIDSVLGSGTKQGYIFECTYAPLTSEFLWMATARPVVPTTTGDRYFATNHQGVIFYSPNAPIPITPDCSMPQQRPDIVPVGR